jgi:hypothetical protein
VTWETCGGTGDVSQKDRVVHCKSTGSGFGSYGVGNKYDANLAQFKRKTSMKIQL